MKRFIFVCFLLIGCQSNDQSTQVVNAIPVLASRVEVKDIPVHIEAIGILQPAIFMEISPSTGGKVTDVYVKEGEWVKKGTPLFTVDREPHVSRIQEAKAQLALDTISLEAVEKKLDRFKTLAEKDLISQTEWDELKSESLKSKAHIDIDRVKLHAATFCHEQCTSRSPIDGRVGKLDIHPGCLITQNRQNPVATISKMDSLIVEFSITEKEFASLPEKNRTLEIEPLSTQELSTSGSITFLDNHFDPKSGLLLVRGTVQNAELTLRPGQAVRVRVPIALLKQAKIIPERAVRYNQEGPYVYVVEADNTASLRQIKLGKDLGSDVVVEGGLDATELIVTDGFLRLLPGATVEVKT